MRADTAIEEARSGWVRVIFDQESGRYNVEPQADHSEPIWPNLEHDDVMDIAFSGREINSLDHPVIKRLMGELSA